MDDTFNLYLRALDEYFKAITQTLITTNESLYKSLGAKIDEFRTAMKPTSKDPLEAMFIWFHKVRTLMRANEDIVPTLCDEKILSQLALVTTPTKVDLLTKMRATLKDSYGIIMRRFEDTQHESYDEILKHDLTKIRALTDKYGNKDLLVAAMRENREEGQKIITDEIDRLLRESNINSDFPPIELESLPGTDLVFSVDPLINAKYILDHGLDMVSPASGIDRRAIEATRTIIEGSPASRGVDALRKQTDTGVSPQGVPRIEKAIAGCIAAEIMTANKSPISLDALIAMDLENTRMQRASQQQYRGLQRVKLESGVNILDTVEVNDLYGMWRYKEVKNVYMSYLRSKSRHQAILITAKSKQYGANDTPMSMIYERAVATKQIE